MKRCIDCVHSDFSSGLLSGCETTNYMVFGVEGGVGYCKAVSTESCSSTLGYERNFGQCGKDAALFQQKGKCMNDQELMALNSRAGEKINEAVGLLKTEVGAVAGELQGIGAMGAIGFIGGLMSGDNELVQKVGPAVSQLFSGLEEMRQVNAELVARVVANGE